MTSPLVSIIVPVYKAEEWIGQALASIDAQTYKRIELIVEDDSQATGAAAARNRGLAKATGDYVAFCDADDYMEPEAIERMVEAIDGVDLVCGSYRKFGDFEQIVRYPSAELTAKQVADYTMSNLRNPSMNQMLSGCWAKLYKRHMMGHFPPLTTAEDMAFNFDYLAQCKNVRFLIDVVYNNRKHAKGSLTTRFDDGNKSGLFGFLQGMKRVKHFLAYYYPTDEVEDALDNSKVYHSSLYFMRICNQEGGSMRDNFKRLYP